MLTKSVLALGAIALGSSALLMPQGGGRQQEGFTDCDLDIRPNNPNTREVQVYWKDNYAGSWGMLFELWGPEDGIARVALPDGSGTAYDLVSGKVNRVAFRYASGTEKTEVAFLCDNPDPSQCTWLPIDTIGSFNEGLGLETPTYERARPPTAGEERLLIKGYNYGLEFHFSLTRTVP
jgi:hypothetical protein